jgi:ribosome recycling factor
MTEWTEKVEKLMQEDLNRLETNLKKIRSNKISLEALEEVLVEQQGKKQKVKHLATLKVNSERQVIVHAFEPEKIRAIEKAILDSQLGYQRVKMEKNEIYFSLALMTEDIRNQLKKKVKEMVEKGKTDLQISRKKVLKELKEEETSQNQQKIAEKEIEKIKEKYLKRIQELQTKKEKELTF